MRTVIPKDAVLVPDGAERVFEGFIFDVYQWKEKMFDGSFGTYEMLKRPDTVEVLVVEEGKILIQNQKQPHLGQFTSFPGGRHDHENETELEAAKRELREETGFTCKEWSLIEAIQPHWKIEQFVYTFLAFGIVNQVPQELDSGEKIENKWATLEEVKTLQSTTKFRSQSKKFLKDIKSIDDLLKLPEYSN